MVELEATWVVVVNFNGGAANTVCLQSVLAQGVPPKHIVFVDNASQDGSREAIRVSFPGVVSIANSSNVGFGDAANQGLQLAIASGAQAVLLLNNDAFLEGDCLRRLVTQLDSNERIGVCGPLVLLGRTGTRVWATGGRMTWRTNLSQLVGHGRELEPASSRVRDSDYVPGCAMLLRRALIEDIGVLDGALFAYHEDVDYCLRARAAGWRVVYDGTAVCRHDAHLATGGGYNARRKYMMAVNSVWFLRRHGSPSRWFLFALFDVLPVPLLVLLGLGRGRWRGALAKGLGHWHGAMGRRVCAEYLEPGANWLW